MTFWKYLNSDFVGVMTMASVFLWFGWQFGKLFELYEEKAEVYKVIVKTYKEKEELYKELVVKTGRLN